ncbi:hypothetical protein ACO0LB_17755 [Undibacterium sp. SXout7W]|uniref:hypothetical protein n=1 Tax=Undibacterium sp. SXout7W TaxID=3413049 RepID=UPI003BF266AA
MLARIWREQNGYTGRAGVIVLFQGNVQGWVNTLRNPEHWQPGCIAVNEEGPSWTTMAGSERNGALMWMANVHDGV